MLLGFQLLTLWCGVVSLLVAFELVFDDLQHLENHHVLPLGWQLVLFRGGIICVIVLSGLGLPSWSCFSSHSFDPLSSSGGVRDLESSSYLSPGTRLVFWSLVLDYDQHSRTESTLI